MFHHTCTHTHYLHNYNRFIRFSASNNTAPRNHVLILPGFRHHDLQGHNGHKILTVGTVSKLTIWQQEYQGSDWEQLPGSVDKPHGYKCSTYYIFTKHNRERSE